MKKFYYADGGNHYGPYSIEELKKFRIFPDTLVWYEGMTDWLPASQVNELRGLVIQNPTPPQSPPQYNQVQQPQSNQQTFFNQQQTMQNQAGAQIPPKNWLVPAVLVTLFCCLPFGVIAIVNATKVDTLYKSGEFAGAQEASKNAYKWVKYAFIGGLIGISLYVIMTVASGVLYL